MGADSTVYVHFEGGARLVRVVENALVPSHVKVRAEVLLADDAADGDLEFAFTKIKFWFDNIVSKAVVFSRANEAAFDILTDGGRNRTGNLLMLTPDEPSDDHLAELFQAKLSALGGGCIVVGLVEVRSDNALGLSFTYDGHAQSALPSMADWMGGRNCFEQPWWGRDDASTIDVVPPEGADLTERPAWAFSLDFLRTAGAQEQPDVIRPQFRPTVIDGGKQDA